MWLVGPKLVPEICINVFNGRKSFCYTCRDFGNGNRLERKRITISGLELACIKHFVTYLAGCCPAPKM